MRVSRANAAPTSAGAARVRDRRVPCPLETVARPRGDGAGLFGVPFDDGERAWARPQAGPGRGAARANGAATPAAADRELAKSVSAPADDLAAPFLPSRSVHRPGRCRVRELRDGIADAAPDRETVVITGSGEFVGARDAFCLGLRAVALQHQAISGSPDAGATWIPVTSGTKQAALTSVAWLADGKTVLAVGEGGTILRSPDAGATWTPVTSGTKAYLTSVAPLADGKSILAVGDGGTILRSPDAGATWGVPRPSRDPPRIAWILWAAGFVALLPAFVALPPTKPPPGDIAQLLATDRPLR
jgi:hypothetical protein